MRHGRLLVKHLHRTYPIQISQFNRGHRRGLLTLAIETSCDDTCVAILETPSHDNLVGTQNTITHGSVNSGPTSTQAQLHFNGKITAKNTGLGGIHPLEALDSHSSNLAKLINTSLSYLPLAERIKGHDARYFACQDGSTRRKPDFVTVTRGPGMRSSLACGLQTAKGLAVAWQVPLLGVHHMQAHALTPRLIHAMQNNERKSSHQPEFPFLTLLVSGGHTMLLYSSGLLEHKILATTADVAIGDTLDKCGRLLLPDEIKANMPDTSFGKYLSEFAFPDPDSFQAWPVARKRGDEVGKPFNQYGWQIQSPFSDTRELAFSFSSIATRTESILAEREKILQQQLPHDEKIQLSRTAIGTCFEHLASRTLLALEDLKKRGVEIQNLVVSGGVAANDFLRYYLREILSIRGYKDLNLIFPPVKYCTDNAAMVAWTGIEMYSSGYSSDLGIDALRKWSMDADSQDGGILGVGGWYRNNLNVSTEPHMANMVASAVS